MKNKNKILIGVAVLVVIIATIAITTNKPKYGSEDLGVPIYENSILTQDTMKEDDIGNTQGMRSYKLEGFKGSIDDIDKFYKENIDKSLWEIEESKKQENDYYMKLTPKSKNIDTEINISVLKSKDKLFTVITSEL